MKVRKEVRLTAEQHAYIRKNFPTDAEGLRRALEFDIEYNITSIRGCIEFTREEISGIFTDGELKLLIDVFNGTMIVPQINPIQLLAYEVSDAIELEGVDKKWKVDSAKLKTKVRKLTSFQALVLIYSIRDFWNTDAEHRSLDKFIENFRAGKR